LTLGTPHVFGPSGLQFAKPVTVVLEFDPTKLPAGKTAANIVVFTAPEGTTNYSALPTKVRDATHVEAETTHFSVMVPTIPEASVAADAGASGGDDAGTSCKPRLCGATGPGTCGQQADGCGGTIDCGSCPTQTDGGSGGTADASAPPDSSTGSCQNPLTCQNYEQAAGHPLCGSYDDGCGNKMFCGDGCQSDGGGSGSTDASATDGGASCQPAPVQCAPTDCTTKFDGCKDVFCFAGCDGSGGGGGSADGGTGAVDAGPCVPQTCASYLPKCGGVFPDGCGGLIDCPCPP
jgi:hypothetical protein